jgi:hypothetical protein
MQATMRATATERSRLVFTALLALGLVAFGPCWRIPGGKLSGTEVTGVQDWSFVDAAPECQVEVRPTDPYSFNAYCFTVGGALHFGCMRCPTKKWPSFVAADPDVRVRFGDRIFALRANRVSDPATLRGAWDDHWRKRKEGEPQPVPEDYWLFRLDPR